ncbi:MAG: pyridoxamine 5'-phosphate oxidase family protein [Acidimicrobiales bacterium]
MEIDRNGLEVLDRTECLRLLATATLGRIGTTMAALPVVLPVNFRLVDELVVFRTGSGTKLEAATNDAVVAFEADDFEPVSHAGWSVVVTGIAREVLDAASVAALGPIPRWAPSGGGRYVSIATEMVSGRRIVPGIHVPREALHAQP